jgi:hypothetical protein
MPIDTGEMKKWFNTYRKKQIRFLQEVVPVVCKDLSGDEECVDMLKEAFGDTFVRR